MSTKRQLPFIALLNNKNVLLIFFTAIFASAFLTNAARAQDTTAIPADKLIKITGTIINDKSGEPLAGATIFIKAKNKAATTDTTGKFSI